MNRTELNKTVLGVVPSSHRLVRCQLETVLEKSGYEVLWVENTPQAAELCRWRQVDAVVLDLPCPLNVCWEFFRQVRAIAPESPMILLTERATPFEQQVAAEVGALLAKPFRVPELVHSINVLLGQTPWAGQPAPPFQMNHLTSSNRA